MMKCNQNILSYLSSFKGQLDFEHSLMYYQGIFFCISDFPKVWLEKHIHKFAVNPSLKLLNSRPHVVWPSLVPIESYLIDLPDTFLFYRQSWVEKIPYKVGRRLATRQLLISVTRCHFRVDISCLTWPDQNAKKKNA